MRDLRAVIHGITTAVLCGVAVFSCSTISKAAGETYQTAVEAAYGDTFRGVYENYLAGSPLEAENPDGVDTASGRLMLSRTDLSLEGTGGMDLELNRYYDSNEANLGHVHTQYRVCLVQTGEGELACLHTDTVDVECRLVRLCIGSVQIGRAHV